MHRKRPMHRREAQLVKAFAHADSPDSPSQDLKSAYLRQTLDLNAVLDDGDEKELMLALRRMSSAFGGVKGLAESAKLNTTTLYRTLSPQGNPELRSLTALLKAMGLRLAVRPI